MERAAGLTTLVGELRGRTRDSFLTFRERIRGYAERIRILVPRGKLDGWIRAVADPEAVVRAPRPLAGAHDVEALLPGQMLGGKSADQWLRDVVGLRRYDNPDYVGPQPDDPSRRVRRMVDRVDLVSYMCTRYHSALTL